MAHITIEGTRKQAVQIFKSANMSTVSLNNPKSFHGGDNYRSVEYRNGELTINDASCANETELREKYSL